MKFGKIKHYVVAALVTVLAVSQSALAQCAMCKAGLDGDPHAQAAMHQMDVAVLMLLTPPVLIFIGFFALIYRFRNHFRASGNDSPGLESWPGQSDDGLADLGPTRR